MEKMGKLFSQIISKYNLGKKINEVIDKDYLYSIEKTIENLTENIENKKKLYRTERSKLNIYHHPFLISKYFCLYLLDAFQQIGKFITSNLITILFFIVIITGSVCLIEIKADSEKLHILRSTLFWYGYWVVLGILSSIGLGTGLHTFVLFLGPHIAEVTTAAYTCGNLNFKVFGEGSFICNGDPVESTVSVLTIFSKIKMQAFFWGLGTAIGELPPYFVSRAASLTGKNNQNISKFEDNEPKSLVDKIQTILFKLLKKLGFIGILLCASIPNPLFDIAGILCGHFLIPFGTFFGATFIGKALIKNSIQSVFIIIAFSEKTINYLLSLLSGYPMLYNFAKNAFDEQTQKFKAPQNDSTEESSSGIVTILWNALITIMIAYFLFSIIESLAISEFNKVKGEELVEIINESKKNLNIKGPDKKVITEITDAAYNYINSKFSSLEKSASRESLKNEIDINNVLPKEQNNSKRNKKLKKGSKKKK
ncbi:hypothetical protein BCR32DRAFT_270437 [Anaeromyces robustus]|uniref:Golgi apparatus membrane protein tvp38 n=1 Tax=Anaeromyces robustus TaxID=1754192 RepID=A0A1Y1WXB1_9FUNG|nr:hypothetical protein BCR32DRAFT_270437 [Anaeromyces robustus]|eukprot:ORX77764.1 hypothetical protein BCR32DRAFT_270437 [Anaeromyces robustus]